jgi:hypothetical protein
MRSIIESMVTILSVLLDSHAVFHDIIVDNTSATDKNRTIHFLPDKKCRFKEKSVRVIFAASLIWAVESVLADSGNETQWLAGQVYVGIQNTRLNRTRENKESH